MQQDLRNLFKKEDSILELPQNHKEDFLVKLRVSQKGTNQRRWLRSGYGIAAVLVLFLGAITGFFTLLDAEKTTAQSTIVQQIESMEKEYLANINREWQNFLILTTDRDLVKRYEKRLDDLGKDYKDTASQFKENPNDIHTIEKLINNLQTRLQLLKDIQEHIKIINQQNEPYENL
ncbi:hypothetical protein [Spongiimicrobium salis]|uniref:hypothetical protein n=1 Tax=Spongiimicrobium salis TaxID=1667022 RepID=UPI00374DACFD